MSENDEISRILQIKFWLILCSSILSIICSILIFIYYYRQRNKLSIHHDLTLILVIFCCMDMITDYPFALIYYHYRKVIPTTPSFCLWWNWWVYSLTAAFVGTAAWGSIERHLVIFHNNLLSTKQKRFYFHILPTLCVILYPYIFYLIIIFFNSCENYWNYNYVFCLQPCYAYNEPSLVLYDFIMHTLIPLTIIVLANVTLIIRVLWQKRNHQRDWYRKWKLTTYLLFISIFFLITWYPSAINNLIYMYTLSSISLNLQIKYFLFLPVLMAIGLPIISVFFLPDFKRIVFRIRPMTINPTRTIRKH